MEDVVWAGLGSSPDIASLRAFIEEFPNGTHAKAARSRLADVEEQAAETRAAEEKRGLETADWGDAAVSTDSAAIEAFLAKWPEGEHAAAARQRLRELKGSGRLVVVFFCLFFTAL